MSTRSIVIGAIVLLAGAAYLFVGVESEASASNTVVVYKNASCGCCAAWIDHMKESGYDVEVHDINDVNPVKDREGVYPQLRSCHTATVGGYVLEGHVPAEHVTRLLAEQPAIRGLAVPGMPIGSPGMEQGDPADYDTYDVVAFTNEGDISVFARVEGGSSD